MSRGAQARRAGRAALVVGLVVATAGAGRVGQAAAVTQDVVVRASEPFAPCLEPALAAFARQTGVRARLEVADPDPATGADVVVGDDLELTRVLEGGTADLATAIDLGTIPWVFVAPPGAPAEIAAAAASADRVVALGGKLGRQARASLGVPLPAARLRTTRDRAELRAAAYAFVPRSLAGPGEQRPAAVHPLVGVAAAVRDSANPAAALRLLAFLGGAEGRALLSGCLSPMPEPGANATGEGPRAGEVRASGAAAAAAVYASSVVDWWLPGCTLQTNGYNDPSQVLGAPNAVYLGVKDQYTGFMSLGQGGYVTVDMGSSAIDGSGADIRVYQTTSREEVTLYGATSPQGPFRLLGLRVPCGERSGGGIYSFHCDFDLAGSGLTEARYLKIEDGEIYPCRKAGTITEGPDIDAVEILNARP